MSKIVKPDLTYQWASAAGGGISSGVNDFTGTQENLSFNVY